MLISSRRFKPYEWRIENTCGPTYVVPGSVYIWSWFFRFSMRVDTSVPVGGVNLALVKMSRRLRGLEIATIILSKSRCGSSIFW
jgi:hypothetical protein